MSNKIFIDTLFVVALINQRDEYHEKAIELSNIYEGASLITSDVVLLEIGNALARNFKKEAIQIIDDFLSSSDVEIVRITPLLFERAYSIYKQYYDKDWGLIDCVSFAIMKEKAVKKALTFDQHFIQAGFLSLMRH